MGAFLTGGTSSNAQAVIKYDAIQIGTSQFNIPIPLFWGQRRLSYNLIWYNDFKATPVDPKGKGGGKGGQQFDYTAAVICAFGEGIIDLILNVFQNGSTTTTTTLSELGFTFYDGSAVQTPPSFITSKYPAEALSYALTSYVFNPKLDMGSTPTVPDNAFECRRLNGFTDTLTSDGWTNPTTHVNTPGVDVSMADVLTDFLISTQYGMGFSSGDLPSMTFWRDYMDGQGLYYSPLLVSQEPATSIIDRWAQMTNTWIYWNGIALEIVPLGDSAVGSYVPALDAAFDVGLADFVGSPPVKISRKDPADCKNRLSVQFTDRTLGYAGNTSEYKDQTLVDDFGLRDASSVQCDEICNPAVAQIVSQLLGKREAYIRRTLTFTLNWRFIRVLPGTILNVTEPNVGLNLFRVRVRTIEENDSDGSLRIEAEELPPLIGTFFSSMAETPSIPTFPDTNVDPGDVNTPAIFEPNSSFPGGVGQILVSLSGDVNWGGADVYVGFNGSPPNVRMGTVTTPAVQGLLTAGLPSHVDPDTVDTLSVDTSECNQAIGPVTHADADAFRTLWLISAQPSIVMGVSVVPNDGELGAFGNTATTSTFGADLTYLRRGAYGSTIGAHSTGDQFSIIDVSGTKGCTLKFNLPPDYIGGPIRFKFVSFNSFKRNFQDISTVTEYQYTPTGITYGGGSGGVPTTPTGLTASGGIQQVAAAWNANPATDNVTTYQLWAAAGASQPFGSTSLVWSGNTLNEVLTNLLPNQTYTLFVVAVNQIGSSSPSTSVNVTTLAVSLTSVGANFSCAKIETKTLNAVAGRSMAIFPWTILSVANGGFIEGKVDVAPSVDTDFDLLVDGVSIGTARWPAGLTTATLIKASNTNQVLGDYLDLKLPTNLNGMSGAFGLAVYGVKG